MSGEESRSFMRHQTAKGVRCLRVSSALLAALCLLLPGLVLITSSPHASAQDPTIDLQLGQEASTPWSLDNIKPGDSGIRMVDVRNLGSNDAQLAIWISELKEYDLNGDGAHLGEYLKFEVRSGNLFSSLEMPASIRDFPSSPSDLDYVWILNVRAGELVTFQWYWIFEENYASQNDAQGDKLSFTINYMLGDMPPPSQDMRWMSIEILGETSIGALDQRAKAVQRITAVDGSGLNALTIEKGTRCLGDKNNSLDRLVLNEYGGRLTPPEGQVIVGPIYSLRGYDLEGNVSQSLFNRGASLVLAYDPSLLPSNTTLVGLYYHQDTTGWVPLPRSGMGDLFLGSSEGLINRSGEIAVLATFNPVESAYFLPSDLVINPSQVRIWEPVTFVVINGDQVSITVIITNIGQVDGTGNVTLEMNGIQVARREITLGPLERQQLSFILADLNQGSYEIKIAGLDGGFVVATEVNWWLIFGFTILFAGVISAGAYSIRRWRQTRNRMAALQRNLRAIEGRLTEYQGTISGLRDSQQRVDQAAQVIQAQMIAMQEKLSQEIKESKSGLPQEPVPIYPSFQRAEITGKGNIEGPGLPSKESKVLVDEKPRPRTEISITPAPSTSEVESAKTKILKMATISSPLSLESITRGKDSEIAVKALVSLIHEKKVRAVQRSHGIEIVLNETRR